VPLRHVLTGEGGADAQLPAAAALAACLLDTPRVFSLRPGDEPPIDGCAHTTTEASSSSVTVAFTTQCDALVGVGERTWSLAAGDALVIAGSHDVRQLGGCRGLAAYAFSSSAHARRGAAAGDAAASPEGAASPVWEDPLHGKRGRTPTTVVQWSKGPPAAGAVQRPEQH